MYLLPEQKWWSGRTDTEGVLAHRWHQEVKLLDGSKGVKSPENNCSFALVGYASDLGVALNQGRIGAYKGPDALRAALANLPVIPDRQLFDAGNFVTAAYPSVELLQEEVGLTSAKLIESGYRLIILGGGHDVTYASFLALQKEIEASKAFGFINFDAHFDLRKGIDRNSGTSYFHIHEAMTARKQVFHYLAIGIQSEGNTEALFHRAKAFDVAYRSDREVHQDFVRVSRSIDHFIFSKDRLHLSIDLDVLNVAFAPGVSAINPQGITPWQLQSFLSRILASGKVASVDIAEYNPDYDRDMQTGRLGARLIQQILAEWV